MRSAYALVLLAAVLILAWCSHEPAESLVRLRVRRSATPQLEFNYVPKELERIRAKNEDSSRYRASYTGPFPKADVIIVGAGLSGAVIAERYARVLNKRVLILERRPHIGGNCFDYVDDQTGVLMNLYGAHLFHTNYEDVWHYVRQFSGWVEYHHRVKGLVDGKIVPIPVNIDTVNKLLGQKITSKEEMAKWLEKNQEKPKSGTIPANGEEGAKGRVGKELYEKIFEPYTWKQWAKSPKDLAASVLNRIPVRDDWNDRYFPADKYQALPAKGYTNWFEGVLDHPNITVRLDTDYFKIQHQLPPHEKLYFTGPIDDYFSQRGWEKLEYRSIVFEKEYVRPQAPYGKYYQAASVVNYPQFEYGNFTRIVEYNQFPNLLQKNPVQTQSERPNVIVKEYSTDDGEPYYPVPNEKNQKLYSKYQNLANEEQAKKNVYFVGRLASYKYFNMDQAIKNALDLWSKIEGIPAVKMEPEVGSSAANSKGPSEHISDSYGS